MRSFDPKLLKKLYIPPSNSHKGQNGKLLMIGGSQLFHASSLWALTTASRIVDMVFYSSVPVNNEIVKEQKREFRNGIVVPRDRLSDYIDEANCILIGPGLPRKEGKEVGDDDTGELTSSLLRKYPHKKWVIDGGSLQTIKPEVIPQNAILTPHPKEFKMLFSTVIPNSFRDPKMLKQVQHDTVKSMAEKFNCVVLLKGPVDIVCSPKECVQITGGNAGMTKGGTGDVLSGLVAGLYCKNEAFLSAACASFINKKAGDSLFKRVGYYFNASDLANEIPRIMKQLV